MGMRGVASMNALAIGFQTLLRVQGEPVTFRGKSVRALVNRTPASARPQSAVNIGTDVGAVVQFPTTVAQPKQGESVEDQFGITHSFSKVAHYGHCWNCECTTIV
jgi:hypothetical protein